MGIQFWELQHSPYDEDENRWQLKLKMPPGELLSLLNDLPCITSAPKRISEESFNYEFFIFKLKGNLVPLIIDFLKERCPIGEVIDKNKTTAFGSMIDDLAQSFSQFGQPEPPKQQKENQGTVNPEQPKEEEKKPKPEIDAVHEEKIEPIQTEEVKQDCEEILLTGKSTQYFDSQFNSAYNFESFITGSSNEEDIIERIKNIIKNPGINTNQLIICGRSGTGKTHLLHAAANYAFEIDKNKKIYYLAAEYFINNVINSFKNGSFFDAKKRYLQADLILVDDFQLLTESSLTQKQAISIFNYLLTSGKQIIIALNRDSIDFNKFESQLKYFCQSGSLVEIPVPDLEISKEILKRKASFENISLSEEDLQYVILRLRSDISLHEEFIKRVSIHISYLQAELNRDALDGILNDLVPIQTTKAAPEIKAVQVHNQLSTEPIEIKKDEPVENITVVEIEKPIETVKLAKEVKTVEVVYFYPAECLKELEIVKTSFGNVFDSHNFSFIIKGIYDSPYEYKEKIIYRNFPDICKIHKTDAAIILCYSKHGGSTQTFAKLISSVMSNAGMFAVVVPWTEIRNESNYLYSSLDIAIFKKLYQ